MLNLNLIIPTFRMETVKMISNSLRKGKWFCYLDIQDTYFHIPIQRGKGVKIHQYLNDWLIRAVSKEQCLTDSKTLILLIKQLGWLINFKKSELIPTQELDFLGYCFNFVQGLVYSTEKRTRKTKNTGSYHQKPIAHYK